MFQGKNIWIYSTFSKLLKLLFTHFNPPGFKLAQNICTKNTGLTLNVQNVPAQTNTQTSWIRRLSCPVSRPELTADRSVHSYTRSSKIQYGLQKRLRAAVANCVLPCWVAVLNWLLACKMCSPVQDWRSLQVHVIFRNKIVRLLLASILCIPAYIKGFNKINRNIQCRIETKLFMI
jgi:hypothetical protein